MQLRELMTPNVEVVAPDAVLQSAAKIMRDLNVGSVPVCNGRKLVGMITDRDIAVRAIADGRDARSTRIEEVMTPNVIFCYDDQDEQDAALAMEEHQIRRLPIINREKQLVGIVSLGDLVVDSQDRDLAGETIQNVSYPARPER